MFGHLAPPGALLCEAFGDEQPGELFAEEVTPVRHAMARRRREFALGRTCARRALARLGFDAVPIPAGPKREPIWPEGSVGSITHCRGYCAAAVGLTETYMAIGIDAEPNMALLPGLLDKIALPGERDHVRQLGPRVAWDRLLFCIKESVYKVWYPITALWLAFEQVRVDIDADSGTFGVTLLVDGSMVAVAALQAARGRFAATDDLLFSLLTLPRTAL